MEERDKDKNLAVRLYNLNVLPLENLRGSDVPDIVMINLHDKADETDEKSKSNSEGTIDP